MIKHLVAILFKKCSDYIYIGTGFFFGDSSHVITCRHNLENKGTLLFDVGSTVFLSYEEEIIEGKVSKILTNEDIAIIGVDDDKKRPFYSYTSMRRVDQNIIPNHIKCMCIGFEYGVKKERINHAFPSVTGNEKGRLILHNANEIKKGFSGAPLLTVDNCLLGMVYSYDTIIDGKAINVANAIPIEKICELVDLYKSVDIPAYPISSYFGNSSGRVDWIREELMRSKQVKTSLNLIPKGEKILFGREEFIKSIHELLEQNDIVFIYGDGGVGKTAVATEIVNQIKNEIDSKKSPYEHVAWIKSTGNLEMDLIGISTPSVINAQTINERIDKAKEFFQTTSTFLVIDNWDHDPTTLEANTLNTISGRTKILITTRAIISDFHAEKLDDLDLDSAIILFYQHYMRTLAPTTNEQVAQQRDYLYAKFIVEKAGCNALFIELIGCMAREDHWELKDLWEKLEKNLFSQDSRYPIHTKHGNDDTLLAQIKTLYEMSSLSKCQKEIMSFIALFPADCSIFFKVFDWGKFDEEDMKVNNLTALENRGWIERDVEGYYIHTMVWGSVKLQQGTQTFDEDRFENLISELGDTPQYMPDYLEFARIRKRIVIPETICSLLEESGSNRTITAILYNNLAGVFLKLGNIEKSLKFCQKALAIYKGVLEKDHLGLAVTYGNIANVYEIEGNYKEAIRYYTEALKVLNNATQMCYINARACQNQDNNKEEAEYYNIAHVGFEAEALKCQIIEAKINLNMAVTYRNCNDYMISENYVKRALSFLVKEMGEDFPDTMSAYSTMASVCAAQRKYDDAEKYYKKAQGSIEKARMMDQPSIAVFYKNQADMWSDRGNHKAALDLYEKALEINERILGKDHLDTAMIYLNIAAVYRDQKKYKNARKYYWRAVPFYKTDKDKRGLATLYSKIAEMYFAEKKYKKAIEYYKKDKEIREEVCGKEHPDTAVTYNNIAVTYYLQEKYASALEYYLKALAIREEKYGKSHSDTEEIYFNIALLYRDKEEYSEALKYYLLLVSSLEKRLGKSNPIMVTVYYNTANLNGVQGNFEEAMKYYDKACAVYEKVNSGNYQGIVEKYYQIAKECCSQKNYNGAINYLEKALLISEEKLGKDYEGTAGIYVFLGALYERIGEYEKAKHNDNNARELLKRIEKADK